MRKRIADFLPVIVVLAGLAILLYPTVSNFLVERNASRVISNYDAAVENLTEEQYAQLLDAAHDYNERLAVLAGASEGDAGIDVAGISAESLREEYDGLLNLNGDGMMGYITIPRLNVTMPIYHTVAEPVLQVGAGHLETSSLPVGGASTHAALSGHRGLPSAKLFTELDKLVQGDEFYIRILNETFAYQVDDVSTVLPHETEGLAIRSGDDLCTLITCTPYGINSHRLLVQGRAVPYDAAVEAEVGKTGDFINIPLPYALLLGALSFIALVLAVLKVRACRLRARMRKEALAAPLYAPMHGKRVHGAYAGSERFGPYEKRGGAHAKRRNR